MIDNLTFVLNVPQFEENNTMVTKKEIKTFTIAANFFPLSTTFCVGVIYSFFITSGMFVDYVTLLFDTP